MMHRRSRQQQHLLVVVVALSTLLAFASVPSVLAQSLDVQVDCDTKQVTISFDGISNPSENWIGIYRETILTNTLPSLPDHSLELWEDWFNTCQSKNECSDWPSSGDVVFNGLITTVQLRAILATGESLDTDAVSKVFRIDGDCATSGGDDDDDNSNTDDSNNNNDDTTNSNDDILAAVQECHDDLQALIEDNLSLIGLFLRLVFHDSVGGSDGCIDMSNPDNLGLDGAIDDLQPIVDRYESRGLTRTDVWMMSGLVASEVAVPDSLDVGDFPLRWFGRKTCGSDVLGGPSRTLCHGSAGTQTIQSFFQDEYGFNDRQIVAIMGAHSVGRMNRRFSGNDGNWDRTPTQLDSGYYLEMTSRAPDWRLNEVDNSDIDNMPNRMQWEGVSDGGDGVQLTMMNSDLALVMQVKDVDEIDCEFLDENGDACSGNTPFIGFVEDFADDTVAFLNAYRDVLNLLIDHGHSKSGCDPDAAGICKFNN